MTSALRWGWVVSTTPRPLYPRERPGTYCTGGWVGPRAGLDVCGKSRPPPGFDPRTVQPVASRYTDWAIPAPEMSTRNISWGVKAVGGWGLPPSRADRLEIWEPQPPAILRACQGLFYLCIETDALGTDCDSGTWMESSQSGSEPHCDFSWLRIK